MGNCQFLPCPCGLNSTNSDNLVEDEDDNSSSFFLNNTSTVPPKLPAHFAQLYKVGELLGAGTTSRVFRVHRRAHKSNSPRGLLNAKSMYNLVDSSSNNNNRRTASQSAATTSLDSLSTDSYELVLEKSLFADPQSSLPLACKIIDKTELALGVEDTEFVLAQLRKEIGILRRIVHNNIVRYFDYTETANHILIVTECLSGGELFHHLAKCGPLSEQDAKRGFWGLFSAVAYLHDRGIIHRDIKPENVVLAERGDMLTMKFIDFGFSTVSKFSTRGSFLGTGGYIAPEIRQGRSYTFAVDDWAMGVLLFCSLCARLPFGTSIDLLPLKRDLCNSQFTLRFPPSLWSHISEDCKDLIRKLLVVDPLQRLTAQGALQHPWFADMTVVTASKRTNAPCCRQVYQGAYLHPSLHSHAGGQLLEIEEMYSPLRKMRSMLPLETKPRVVDSAVMTRSRSSAQLLCSSLDYDQLQLRLKQPSFHATGGKGDNASVPSITTDTTFVDSDVDLGDSDTVVSPPAASRRRCASNCTFSDGDGQHSSRCTIVRPALKKNFSDDNFSCSVQKRISVPASTVAAASPTVRNLTSIPQRKRKSVKFFGDELHDGIAGTLFFSTYIPCYETSS